MKQIAFAQIGVFGRVYWGATYCHKKMACSATPDVALMIGVCPGGGLGVISISRVAPYIYFHSNRVLSVC